MRLSWSLPPECTTISQRFGENPGFYKQFGLAGHEGLDIACPIGTPVLATHDGWCEPRWSGRDYGDQVWLHGDGLSTLYAHLNQTTVAFGQQVERADQIGLSGDTGRWVTGPHLHLGLKIGGVSNREFKDWLDPEPYLRRETMSKLNPHLQKIPDWAKLLWANCKNEWYKVVLPPIGDPFPGKKGIGRPWIGGDEVEQAYIRDDAAGAARYFARLRQYYLDRPYIWAWEAPNEPHPMGDYDFRAALDGFTYRWIELMHSINKRTVILCLSVGWPDKPEHILEFAPSLQHTDYWALHEYSAPTMQHDAGWHCLRYRRTVQALRDAGHRVPPLLITECGIDGGVLKPPQGKTGWKTHARDEEDYMGQLAWCDRELCQDGYVKAAFIFTSGPESEWVDFEVNEVLTRKLVAHINAGGPLPAEPEGPVVEGFTQAEREEARRQFERHPATMKAANQLGYVWQKEWEFNGFYFALVYLPADHKYKVIKLEPQTWQLVATIDL